MNVAAALALKPGSPLLSADELEQRLHEIGATRYHNRHPFHRLLHDGKLNKGQVQAWALNRYYYQSSIPIKDAVVISRFRDRNIRLEWRHRAAVKGKSVVDINQGRSRGNEYQRCLQDLTAG